MPFRKKMDMSTVIMYNQDCADLCRLTAQLLERKSENADIFLTALVMCERCASE
jgi:predicted DCC family thiol-disulfide oxidoreductase YuxK